MKIESATATWFCSACMGFKEHTNFKMISDDVMEGTCSCGKENLQVFPNKPRNPIFGTGEIEPLK